ncbi:MAG: hypothetical protein GXO71_00915 [Caldiserica bacterium]|nr:hypothetical protein [Caldisericota bacterium]
MRFLGLLGKLTRLLNNVKIGGIYLDGIGYDREIMKRVRKVLNRERPGSLIDFHSGNTFHPQYDLNSCANLYLEHFPYIDSLWFPTTMNLPIAGWWKFPVSPAFSARCSREGVIPGEEYSTV